MFWADVLDPKQLDFGGFDPKEIEFDETVVGGDELRKMRMRCWKSKQGAHREIPRGDAGIYAPPQRAPLALACDQCREILRTISRRHSNGRVSQTPTMTLTIAASRSAMLVLRSASIVRMEIRQRALGLVPNRAQNS